MNLYIYLWSETNIFIHQSIDKYKDRQSFKDVQGWLESTQVTGSTETSTTSKGEKQHMHGRETLDTEGGRKSPTKDAKCFAPCLANWSVTWLAEWGTQKREQPNSLAICMILCIRLSNFCEPLLLLDIFHEPLFLLVTQYIALTESPFIVRLDRHKALACDKPSNNANIPQELKSSRTPQLCSTYGTQIFFYKIMNPPQPYPILNHPLSSLN